MILLYVSNPLNSLKFYETILGTKAIDQAPGFAMLPFNDATILGLWIESGVKPAAGAKAGATELAFHLESRTAVDSILINGNPKVLPWCLIPPNSILDILSLALIPMAIVCAFSHRTNHE